MEFVLTVVPSPVTKISYFTSREEVPAQQTVMKNDL